LTLAKAKCAGASELHFEQTITCPYVCRNSSPYR
jgi:hypothetical protein